MRKLFKISAFLSPVMIMLGLIILVCSIAPEKGFYSNDSDLKDGYITVSLPHFRDSQKVAVEYSCFDKDRKPFSGSFDHFVQYGSLKPSSDGPRKGIIPAPRAMDTCDKVDFIKVGYINGDFKLVISAIIGVISFVIYLFPFICCEWFDKLDDLYYSIRY